MHYELTPLYELFADGTPHSEPSAWMCDECSAVFGDEGDAEEHAAEHEPEREERERAEAADRTYDMAVEDAIGRQERRA